MEYNKKEISNNFSYDSPIRKNVDYEDGGSGCVFQVLCLTAVLAMAAATGVGYLCRPGRFLDKKLEKYENRPAIQKKAEPNNRLEKLLKK